MNRIEAFREDQKKTRVSRWMGDSQTYRGLGGHLKSRFRGKKREKMASEFASLGKGKKPVRKGHLRKKLNQPPTKLEKKLSVNKSRRVPLEISSFIGARSNFDDICFARHPEI